jgi:ATP-dependent helicase/nuclease subunit A
MKNIEIISASAGSGKTHELTRIMVEEVVQKKTVRPDAILATTFTKKAASELKERIFQDLLAEGRPREAQRLGASRIGTVNSVCGRIISDFAFDLGLSPDLRVLDDVQGKIALRRSLSSVITPNQEADLSDIEKRMGDLEWIDAVGKIIDFARNNRLGSADLEECLLSSLEGFEELLGEEVENAKTLDGELKDALKTFIGDIDIAEDTTAKTKNALTAAQQALNSLNRGRALTWATWAKLVNLDTAVRSRDFLEPVHLAAAKHDRHPGLRADGVLAIKTVFKIASDGIGAYQEYKRELGVLDFVDQEVHCLDLLENPLVVERLKENVELVMVDEFHDTSPIQLAIFLRLAEIAPRSIWVGDQKQSIYGFRGADPALMDVIIEALLGKKEPHTLSHSWRSVAPLVEATSNLFAEAFVPSGFPEARVRLTPSPESDPDWKEPVFERWILGSRNRKNDVKSVANGIREFLEDPDVRVRDRETKETRRVKARDIAILCRTNATCAAVAEELGVLGVDAVLPQANLVGTAEGIVALAALRLWVDARDRLSAAILARIIEYGDCGDAWLDKMIAEGAQTYAETPAASRVIDARDANPLFGPLAAFDAAIEALGLCDLCLRWGDSDRRLANLDQLRTHALNYEQECQNQGAGATTAGLAAYFDKLAGEELDSQASLSGRNGVTVISWHRAKGLEWPVTILFETDKAFDYRPTGVKVISKAKKIDINAPLANRWIRYWPYPYDKMKSGIPFVDRAQGHPSSEAGQLENQRQELRLLYVGWTRARDRLVIAARSGKLGDGILSHLCGESDALLSEPDAETGTADWGGEDIPVIVRCVGPDGEPAAIGVEDGLGYGKVDPREYPPAFMTPSAVEGTGKTGEAENIGDRLDLLGDPDMTSLGSALHAFLGADRPGLEHDERVKMADYLRSVWEVSSALTSESFMAASDTLKAWVDENWADATWHRELPLFKRFSNGTQLRGCADLVLETEDGIVIVDHKSFPGNHEQAIEKAQSVAGQVLVYGDAATDALKKPLLGCYVHLPVSGTVISVEGKAS